jgi:succinoglycan biosynthesis protein ExoM
MLSAPVRKPVDITICIATFKRRQLLTKLLARLSQLEFRMLPAPAIKVVVVDNDADRSGEEVCAEAKLPWDLKYLVEPRRGIAVVRNRAVREAGNPHFVAFLDDDEIPSSLWLDELLDTQEQFDADVVAGPVFADFASDVPQWIASGEFFKRESHATGHLMDKCSSNNVLIRREVFDRVPSFNEDFELTGADDTEFFLRVRRSGFRIVWANDAVVYEDISMSRANFSWLMRRSYRLGNSWSLCELSVDGGIRTASLRFLKALARMAQGAGAVVISPFFGKARFVRALQTIWHGVGELTGLAGHRYQEYRHAGKDSVAHIDKISTRPYRDATP